MIHPLLEVKDLRVEFQTRKGTVPAVKGVSLGLNSGATLGIVGESGSGKSVTAFAITRLLDRAGRISSGSIFFKGHDLVRCRETELRKLRGAAMSMIFQNPRAALNPIRTVGQQIIDVLAAHTETAAGRRQERAVELLDAVRIRDPHKRIHSYPHELSGGMCQRIMIALAMACGPDLLIADEPTTGLDVTTQKTVMDLLATLTRQQGMGLVLITHDLGLASQYCDDIVVMQNGLIVERASALEIFTAPQHPYTQRLVAASPTASSTVEDLVREDDIRHSPRILPQPSTPVPILTVKGLGKIYGESKVVDDVHFTIKSGESVGLVGESGSGKSTTSRMICRLLDHNEGEIHFCGHNIGNMSSNQFHNSPFRREIQLVFQDPHDSLNPRHTAFDSIAHPLKRLENLKDTQQVRERVTDVAERVGLPTDLLTRYPHQLSGGQKARVGIARAIVVRPKLLVLDEPTAALDVSVQAVILKLLDDLRREEGLAFLFVSHDLNVVRMMCERIIVLQKGMVVEQGNSEALFTAPKEPYTRELLDAIPSIVHKVTEIASTHASQNRIRHKELLAS